MPGLYLHIPFCVRKCLYCDFYSLPTGSGPIAGRLASACGSDNSRFLDALDRELSLLPADFRPETVFIGGGTPTELSDRDFTRLFEVLKARIDLSRVAEWTCESNPGTLTAGKARILKAAGVNRMSLGVQSFDPRNLEFLGRIHSSDEAADAFRLLRRTGFENINLDLIYAIPGSSRDALERDLDRIAELAPEHVACYALIFEDGTPLTDLRDRGFVKEVDDDEQFAQYQCVRNRLAEAGYAHYEISNFARPGRECRHNILYWSGAEYLGCGPSAHSHWQGLRYGNVRSLEDYCASLIDEGRSPREFEERLEPEAKARETLVMSLRRLDGVSRSAFKNQTGFDYADLCGATLRRLESLGLLDASGERLRLTEEGLFVSDGVFADLV
jgi:oxygen-independent coproporphyrinogen III oxidase